MKTVWFTALKDEHFVCVDSIRTALVMISMQEQRNHVGTDQCGSIILKGS